MLSKFAEFRKCWQYSALSLLKASPSQPFVFSHGPPLPRTRRCRRRRARGRRSSRSSGTSSTATRRSRSASKQIANQQFSCKILQYFWRARSRLYQNEILQVNMRLKALAEISTPLHRSLISCLIKDMHCPGFDREVSAR